MAGICVKAVDNDANEAYLQVAEGNEKAISVYRKLGFEILYKYWFRKN